MISTGGSVARWAENSAFCGKFAGGSDGFIVHGKALVVSLVVGSSLVVESSTKKKSSRFVLIVAAYKNDLICASDLDTREDIEECQNFPLSTVTNFSHPPAEGLTITLGSVTCGPKKIRKYQDFPADTSRNSRVSKAPPTPPSSEES